jgi:hypothetical protein
MRMTARLFLPKWTEVVLALQELELRHRYYQRLTRQTSVASSYIREVLTALEDYRLLEVKRSGHTKRLVLTALGNQLVFHLREVRRLLKDGHGPNSD